MQLCSIPQTSLSVLPWRELQTAVAAHFHPSNKDSVNGALHERILSSHHAAHRIAVLHPSTKDSSNGALHDVSPFPSWGRIVYIRRCPSFLSHAWQPVVPTIQPINQVLFKPGSWSWCEFSIHITRPSTSLLSWCAFSLHITRTRASLEALNLFHRIKRAPSSPFATSHFPHFLFFTVAVLHSSSLSIRLFVCFLWRSFVCLFALASSLSIEVCYLQYLPASCLYRSSQSYSIRIWPTRR
jgi:hypothetical protein